MAAVFQTLMQAEDLSVARGTSRGSHSKPLLISAVFLDLYFEVGPVIAACIDTIAEGCCWFLSFLLAMIWQTGPGNSAGPTKYTARLSAWFKTSATASLLFAFPAVVRLNGHSRSAEVFYVCLQLPIEWGWHWDDRTTKQSTALPKRTQLVQPVGLRHMDASCQHDLLTPTFSSEQLSRNSRVSWPSPLACCRNKVSNQLRFIPSGDTTGSSSTTIHLKREISEMTNTNINTMFLSLRCCFGLVFVFFNSSQNV